ncbi:hypothetical protein GCM10010246_24830 [Streptomyces cuspidosporus]|uniref:Uncharacterized protein n=1 Tax=Streptomyces cuspidosporus TaxID=66882 RepID=A0ABN3FWI8_9ACTN
MTEMTIAVYRVSLDGTRTCVRPKQVVRRPKHLTLAHLSMAWPACACGGPICPDRSQMEDMIEETSPADA